MTFRGELDAVGGEKFQAALESFVQADRPAGDNRTRAPGRPPRLPGAARTGFDAEISAARARMLACDGNVTRIVVGPEGQPLDLGRDKRVAPPHLRRAVEQRDRHCVFAGCHAPNYWCDVHHQVHWADDGETSLENSALLCERHHTQVHRGFRVERRPDGRWRTYRPDGTEIIIEPLLV